MGIIMIDTRERKPIWEQLTYNITALILRGILKPGEQLPGVRTLAVELAINPNTIAKAYTELERRGTIYSIPGRGSFVCDDIAAIAAEKRNEALSELKKSLENAHQSGITSEDAARLIQEIWEEKQ